VNFRVAAITASFLFIVFVLPVQSSEYAVVDFQKVLNTCSLGQGAKANIKELFGSDYEEAMALKKEIEKIKDKLEDNDTSYSQEKRSSLEEEYNEKENRYNELMYKFKLKDQEYTRLIVSRISLAVQLYNKAHMSDGNDRKYPAIFEKYRKNQLDGTDKIGIDGNTLDLSKADDITDEIISLVDEKYPFEENSQLFLCCEEQFATPQPPPTPPVPAQLPRRISPATRRR